MGNTGWKGLGRERGGKIWVQGRGNVKKPVGKQYTPTCAIANLLWWGNKCPLTGFNSHSTGGVSTPGIVGLASNPNLGKSEAHRERISG